jgi:hypothetical protein
MKFVLILLLLICSIQLSFAQLSYSGNVLDDTDNTYLEGVRVEVIGSEQVDTTNVRGYFSVKAVAGDSLKLSFPGFMDLNIILTSERYLQLLLHDKARLLPTFVVKSEPYAFRFKDGKLTVVDPNEERSEGNSSGISAGYLNSPNGGVAIAGVLSSLTKKARLERQYQKKLEWMKRREGYYAVVESDSVRKNLMIKYQLDRSEWDKMLIRYNEGNQYHEFLDWNESRVYTSLEEFIRRESSWRF